MYSVLRRQPLEPRAIELYPVQIALAPVILVGREINRAGLFIQGGKFEHLPVAARELPHQPRRPRERIRTVVFVEVKMRVAVAPTRPQKAAGAGKKAQRVVHLDIRVIGFLQDQTAVAALDVDEIQALARLRAVEHQRPDNFRTDPAEARNDRYPSPP